MAISLSSAYSGQWLRMCFLYFLFLGFLSPNLLAQNLEPKDEKKTYAKARRLLDAENYEKAKPLFVSLVELKPNNVIYSYEAGLAFFKSEVDKGSSLEYFRNSLRATKGDTIPEIIFYIGRAYQFLGQFQEAVLAYEAYMRMTQTTRFEPGFRKDIPRYIEMCEFGRNYFENNKEHVVVENLGRNINTEYPEYSPAVKDNESLILFTSRRPGTTGEGIYSDGKHYEDIYYSVFANQTWSKAQNSDPSSQYVSSEINTEDHDATISLSGSEDRFFLYRDNDIWASELVDGKWAPPQRLGSTINSERGQETSVLLTKSGNTLFVVSDRKDGYGKRDIWKSELQPDGSWGTLENLGPNINTKYDEDAPFLSADGNTLYFSSKGHSSMGGFDVFKSALENGNWSRPENVGAPINTPGDEIFFVTTADGSVGYYASSRQGGYGDMDIYRLSLQCKNIASTQVKGVIVSEANRKPIGATMIISDALTGDLVGTYTSDPQTGEYEMILPTEREFTFKVTVNDFLSHEGRFAIPRQCEFYALYQEIKIKDINDEKDRLVAQKAEVHNAFFDFDQALKKQFGLRALAIDDRSAGLDSLQAEFISMLDTGRISNFEIITTDEVELSRMEVPEPLPVRQYNNWIEKADRLLETRDYDLAKLSYLEALKNRPETEYAKTQLEAIENQGSTAASTGLQSSENLTEKGDQLMQEGQYELAKLSYLEALKIDPLDDAVKGKVATADARTTSDLIRIDETRYQDLVSRGDEQLLGRDMELAKISYLEALRLDPEAAYPKAQLAKIDRNLDEEAGRNAETAYNSWIEKGDALLDKKEYELAKLSYVEALNMKPSEQYPKDQLQALNDFENTKRTAQSEVEYIDLLQQADQLMAQNKMDDAKQLYLRASGIKPEESAPRNQIKSINKKQEEDATAQRRVKYFHMILEADEAYLEEDYAAARTIYEDALRMMPQEDYPKIRIAKVDAELAQRENLEVSQKFNELIAQGQKAQEAGSLNDAKQLYFQAAQLSPMSTLPTQKIEVANRELRKEARNDGTGSYARAITDADKALLSGDAERARKAYEEAGKLNTNSNYASKQLASLTRMNANDPELIAEKSYQEAVEKADRLLRDKSYDDAKIAYLEAQKAKPTSDYPKSKLIEINDQIHAGMPTAKERNYQELIALGDEALASGNYEQAKLSYLEAQHFFPTTPYAKERVLDINQRLADRAETTSERELQEIIAEADNDYLNQNYDKAKSGYMKTFQTNAAESYSKAIVDLSNTRLVEASADDEDRKVAQQVATADRAFVESRFEDAKEAYVEAIELQGDKGFARDQILAVNNILDNHAESQKDRQYLERIKSADLAYLQGDQATALEEYKTAIAMQPGSIYPKNQIAKLEGRPLFQIEEESYSQLLEKANKAFDAQEYDEAKRAYMRAISIRPNEFYPRQRVDDANRLLTRSGESSPLAKAIVRGDKAVIAGKREDARIAYLKALELDPDNEYSKDQIAAINYDLVAEAPLVTNKRYAETIEKADALFLMDQLDDALNMYADAAHLKTNEAYPKMQLQKIEAVLAERDAPTAANLIATGDQALEAKDLRSAKAAYFNALEADPENEQAKAQIRKINAQLATTATTPSEKQAISLATRGDDAWLEGDSETARDYYLNARQVASDWIVSARLAKLEEVDASSASSLASAPATNRSAEQLMEEAQQANAATYQNLATALYEEAQKRDPGADEAQTEASKLTQAGANSTYESLIKDADQALKDKNYELAATGYELAQSKDPLANYPREQLTYLDTRAIDVRFESAVAAADLALKANKTEQARAGYEKAQSLKPDADYPKQQLAALKQQEAEAEYKELIAKADEAFQKEDYVEASNDYYRAQNLQPKEAYPKQKLEEIKSVTGAPTYAEVVADADAALERKDYEIAQRQYEQAQKMNPGDNYPGQQLQAIADAKTTDTYTELIAQADEVFGDNDYEAAAAAYEKAKELKPGKAYPQLKLNEIEAIENQQRYDRLIAQGNKALNEKNSGAAAAAFEQASALQPNEEFPKNQLNALGKKANASYDKLVAQADVALENKQYALARTAYEKAEKIEPNEAYPQDQLDKLDAIATDAEFNALVEQADENFDQQNYAVAAAAYQKAKTLKPDADKPQQRLDEIAALTPADPYSELIARGDQAVKNRNYAAARTAYREAGNMRPQDPTANEKLKTLASLTSKSAYNDAIAKADAAFDAQNFDDAENNYMEALAIRPNEPHVRSRVDMLKKLKEGVSLDEQYNTKVSYADGLFDQGMDEKALEAYEEALAIKSDGEDAKERIGQINQRTYDRLVADGNSNLSSKELVKAKRNFEEAAQLMPNENYPKTKLSEVNQLIAAAGIDTGSDTDGSGTDGSTAGTIADAATSGTQGTGNNSGTDAGTTGQTTGTDQGTSTGAGTVADAGTTGTTSGTQGTGNNTGTDQGTTTGAGTVADAGTTGTTSGTTGSSVGTVAETAEQAAEAETTDTYTELIAQADEVFADKDYEAAAAAYEKAKELKPGKTYAQMKLQEIEAIDNKQRYDDLIAQGKKALSEKNTGAAAAAFEQASVLQPNEAFPKSQLTALGKKGDASYDKLLSQADQALENKEYALARTAYERAEKLEPNEAYPQDQLDKLDAIATDAEFTALVEQADENFDQKNYAVAEAAYQKAKTLKPNEDKPQQRLDEIAARTSADPYNELIAQADEVFADKDYEAAAAAYEKAKELKPGKTYPQMKLQEITAIDNKQRYDDLIAQGQKAIGEKNTGAAIAAFEQASALQPNEQLPKNQLTALGTKADASYDKLLSQADAALENKEYALARTTYEKANKMQPTENYPKSQLTKLNAIEADAEFTALVEQADENFDQQNYAVAEAAYQKAKTLKPGENKPQQRLDEIAALTQADPYTELIAQADEVFADKNYEAAAAAYEKAKELKPGKSYAQMKLNEIEAIDNKQRYDRLIAQGNKALSENKSGAAAAAFEQAAALQPNEELPKNQLTAIGKKADESYDKLLSQADEALDNKEYAIARTTYEKANKMAPAESYPKNQLSKLEAIETDAEFTALVEQADENFDQKNYAVAEAAYQKAKTLKPDANKPQERLDEIAALSPADPYSDLIAQGDQAVKDRNYAAARTAYREAGNMRPGDPTANDKLKALAALTSKSAYNDVIAQADAAFDAKKFDDAEKSYREALAIRPNESHPKGRVDALKKLKAGVSLEQQYNAKLNYADGLFDQGKDEKALEAYEEALAIKADGQEAKDRIEQINQRTYDRLIADGNSNLSSKAFGKAKANFEAASELKPNESYPKTKLAELDQLIADAGSDTGSDGQDGGTDGGDGGTTGGAGTVADAGSTGTTGGDQGTGTDQGGSNNAGSGTSSGSNSSSTADAGADQGSGTTEEGLLVFKNILFDFDKDELRKLSQQELNKIAEYLSDNPQLLLGIDGHADAIGTELYNMALSKRRANAAEQYLVGTGVDNDRMETRAFGESKPIAPNTKADGKDNPAGRQLNRRCEFQVKTPTSADNTITLKF